MRLKIGGSIFGAPSEFERKMEGGGGNNSSKSVNFFLPKRSFFAVSAIRLDVRTSYKSYL